MADDELKKHAREARRKARRGGDGADIPRDEWGVPLDRDHVRSGLYARRSRWMRLLSGPGRTDFKPLLARKRLPYVAIGLVLSSFAAYFWASQNITGFLDPPMRTEGESDALGPAWQAPLDDVYVPPEEDAPAYAEAFALWPGGGGAVHADRTGVTAYGAEDGAAAWRFAEGEGLCAAASGTAGGDGTVGLVLVEREGGSGDDGADCDTLVALDLDTGEELWRMAPPGLSGVGGVPARDVRVWADGPRALASWGPLMVGLDAADGEVLWSGTGVVGPGEDCTSLYDQVLPSSSGGTAAVLGDCAHGAEGSAPFTAELDTATGEVSGARALPDDLITATGKVLGTPDDLTLESLSLTSLVSADPVAVVHSPAGSLFMDDDEALEEELLVADGGGWTRLSASGTQGVGAASEEWNLSDSETAVAVHGSVLYASPGSLSGDERVVAIDLEAGEVLWDRRIDDHDVQVVDAGGDGVLAVGEYGTGDDAVTRVLSLPPDGEGRAVVLADGLPEQPYRASGAVRVVEMDGGYAVGSGPAAHSSEPPVPLTAARR